MGFIVGVAKLFLLENKLRIDESSLEENGIWVA